MTCARCQADLGRAHGNRRYCEDCGRQVQRERQINAQRARRAHRPRLACARCQADLGRAHGNQRYCQACAAQVWAEQKRDWTKDRRVHRPRHTCAGCGAEFQGGRRYCSPECRVKAQGERSNQRNKRIGRAKTRQWRRLRALILKRDAECCQECGSRRDLQVHHRDGDVRHDDPGNLVTLCRGCHNRVHQSK